MLLAFNLPIVLMLGWSIGAPPDVLAHYAQILERAVYLKVLANTFRIAAIATLVCVLLGYPLAYWMRSLAPGRQLLARGARRAAVLGQHPRAHLRLDRDPRQRRRGQPQPAGGWASSPRR